MKQMCFSFRQILWVLALLVLSLPARPVKADIVLYDGTLVEGFFIRLKSDTVYYEVLDSETHKRQQYRHYRLDLKKVELTESGKHEFVDLMVSDFEVTTQAPQKKDLFAQKKPTLEQGRSYLWVESNPPKARIYVDDVQLDSLTPNLISHITEGKHRVMVRRYLKGVDWWGTADIEVDPGDTAKIMIKLEKPRTRLTIQSVPSGAECYLDEMPSLSLMPTMYTDTTLIDIRPGVDRQVSFFKAGYHDTSLTVTVDAFMPNLISVDLRPIAEDLDKMQYQVNFKEKRKKKWIGRGLLWSSIAPILTGGILLYLAEQDWEKATDYKYAYEDAAFHSTDTDRLIEKNKDLNRSGDQKAIAATALGSIGLILASIGLVFQF